MTSTLKALLSLPEVFDLDEMQKKTGQSRHAVRMMLSRAHANKLVEPAGPRLGVYYNFLKARERKLEAAVKLAIPSAIVIGPSALHWHSVTSQRSHLLSVAWLKNSNMRYLPAMDDVISVPRPPEWFRAIAGHTTEGPGGLPVLDADYAVADMLLRGGGGDIPELDEDDLDLDDADDDVGLTMKRVHEVEQIFREFGVKSREEEAEKAEKSANAGMKP